MGFAVASVSFAPAADPLPQAAADLANKPKQVVREPLAAAPAPQPPALPFTYGGSGLVNGEAIVFLEQTNGSVMAAAGDIVGAYRIEAIERDRALLRYLPLDVVQSLSFGAGGREVLQGRPALASSAGGPLFVNLPDELALGEERPVLFGIAPGSGAARASIEISYDEQELAVSGAKILRPGKALVEVSAQDATRAEIRLRAVATTTLHAEIGIAASAFDAQGKRLEVRGIPALHIVNLVDERG